MEQNNGKTPLVSVVMPAYNAGRFLEEAVRSVMAQTVTDWELLILDDGSTDDTLILAQNLAQTDCRIRVLPNEHNMDVARTRNRGFDLCRGEYVALLDSDDVWLPHKLEMQLKRMEQTGADICYCSYAIVDANGEKSRPDYLVPGQTDFDKLLRENVIGCSTVVLSRKVVENHRFETAFYHEDYVLWLKLLRSGFRAAGCTEPLVHWRLIENSRSFNKRKAAGNRWRIYRDYLHLPLGKSVQAFAAYGAAGLKKYLRK